MSDAIVEYSNLSQQLKYFVKYFPIVDDDGVISF